MQAHAVRCILIHAPRVAVSLNAAAIRLRPFSRTGMVAIATDPLTVRLPYRR